MRQFWLTHQQQVFCHDTWVGVAHELTQGLRKECDALSAAMTTDPWTCHRMRVQDIKRRIAHNVGACGIDELRVRPIGGGNAGRTCNSPVQRSASPMRTLQECERNCPTPKIAQPCKHIPGHAKERFNIGYPICPYGAQYLAIAIGVFVGFADRTNDFTLVVTDHFICIWDKKTEHSMGLASKEFPLSHSPFQREDIGLARIGGSHEKC